MPKIKMELKKLGKELSIKQKQDIQNIFEKNFITKLALNNITN